MSVGAVRMLGARTRHWRTVAVAALTVLAVMVGTVASVGRADSPAYYFDAVTASPDLLGYWPLDETSGTTASDVTSSPANGTYSGGVTLGQAGALQASSDDAPVFNGSTGSVSTSGAAKLQPTSSLTLEAWFKTSTSGVFQGIMFAGQGGGAQLQLNSSGQLYGAVNSVAVQSSASFNNGAWHYVALTWNGSVESLYVDGALAAPASGYTNPKATTTSPTYAGQGVVIGRYWASQWFFHGSIDEPALYGSNSNSSGALSAGVVANHYATGTTGLVETPVNVTAPTVSGDPLVGSTLAVSNGSWNASASYGGLSYSYQWLRCGYDGTACTAISGATGSTYTPVSADNSHALAVEVTASNSSASGTVTAHASVINGYRGATFADGGSNLLGYWPLDDTAAYPNGQAAADISASPAAGTYSGGVTLGQAGPISDGANHAATFNGSNGYVSTAGASKVQPSASLTLEAWFKSSSATWQGIVSSGQGGGPQLLLTSSGQIYASVQSVVLESKASFNDGSWHYVALTWNGSIEKVYVDGALVAPASGYSNPLSETSVPTYGGQGVVIGSYWSKSQWFFQGSIDEPALYGTNSGTGGALTATQIANHFQLSSYKRLLAKETRGGVNKAIPGRSCGCFGSAGDPVNLATGDFSESVTDVSLTSYGPPVSFVRTYDASLAQEQALTSTPGVLGYGWTDDWNMSLSASSSVVTVTQGDGAQVNFYPPVSGSCQAPYVGLGTSGTFCALPEVTATLSYDSGSSTYAFVTHPYESYTFNSSGQLTGESSAGGATMSIAYNSPSPGSGSCPSTATSCTKITSASGRALVIASNSAAQVTKVVDPLGRSWTYTYCSPPNSTCSANDLVSATDPMSRVTSFTYDTTNSNPTLKHDLLTITRPNGQTGGPNAGKKLVNTYDSSGRVTLQTDRNGYATTIDYSNLNPDSGSGHVIATDPDGNETKTTYENGVVVDSESGYGLSSSSTTELVSDLSTLLNTSIVDPNGHSSEFSYDASGNATSSTDQLSQTSSSSYNSFDEQTCLATPMAASPCSSLSPPAAITPGGTITPPSSAPPAFVTYNEYDTAGNLVWTTHGDYDPGSSTASVQRTTYHLYNGESVTLGGHTDSCANATPTSSLPCATINADGVVTQLGYDSAGDLASSSTPDGNSGGEVAKTTYGYDGDGERTTEIAADGNLSGATAADYTTVTAYDNDGEVTSVTVGQTGGIVTPRITSYGYDANGNRTTVTDPRNKTTNYSFDANDQQILATDPDNQSTLTCYDGDGNVTQTVPPVGVAANSLTPLSCPTSYPSGYGSRLASDAITDTFNYQGQKTSETTPAPTGQSGYETTTYTYDAAGNLTETDGPPTSSQSGAPNQKTAYTYDDAGQLVTQTQEGSDGSAASTTSYCYDLDGEKTATVPPDGNTSSVTACSTSAPYQTSSPYQTGYSYDSLGELVSKTRPATTWASSGQTTTSTYDAAGNLLTSQDPNGVTTTNTYTALNQLATVSYSGSSAHSVTYSYDANGNRLSMTDGTGAATYTYDPFNELSSYENGAGNTVSFSYDTDGNKTGITYPLGSGATWAASHTVSYGYDNAGELNSVTDFNGNAITVGNTADGLLNSLTLGSSGDTISTTYDPTDSPSQVTLANSSSTLLQFAYSDMPSGAIAAETDTPSWAGSPASYSYDAQSRVTQMTAGSGSALNYGFDASGNLTTLPTAAAGSYDNASELTSSTLSGTTTSYTYDADGERTQATQGTTTIMGASYDGAQRLAAYSNSAANMSAASYDGIGLRQSDTITATGGSAVTENFTWNPTTVTPQLLLDSNNAYIYGSGDTPIEQVNLSSGTIQYLVSDVLGSVRGIVSSSGGFTASTAYDAWGNPQTGGGLVSYTPFGFAGGYTDATGLVYLIHRFYDPSTGQFLTVDPLVDDTGYPYSYASNDPVDQTDPLGECASAVGSQRALQSASNPSSGTSGPIGLIRPRVAYPHFSTTAAELGLHEYTAKATWSLWSGGARTVTITLNIQWQPANGGWLNLGASRTQESVPAGVLVLAVARCKPGTVMTLRSRADYNVDGMPDPPGYNYAQPPDPVRCGR
jgi:RHS repeat-associated protein